MTQPPEPPPQLPTQPPPERRPWGKHPLLGWRGLLLLIGVMLIGPALFRSCTGTTTTTPGDEALVAAATATVRPTDAPQPSAATEPTPTAEPPTATPSPTPEPTALPEPTTVSSPVEISGEGQTVTDKIIFPAAANRAVFTHQGQHNFIVTWFKPDGSEEGIINEIGAYDGQEFVYGSGEHFFEIKADGPWTLRVEALTEDPAAAGAFEGRGDTVSGFFTPTTSGAVPYRFTHDGAHNFIVSLTCADGRDGLQNEIGTVDNEAVVRFGDPPCIWEVTADGAWTIGPK